MIRRDVIRWMVSALVVSAPRLLRAETYLTEDEARRMLAPGAEGRALDVVMTDAEVRAVGAASGVAVRSPRLKAWRVAGGGWFIIDNVVGKHEFIDFACAIGADGAVKGVEILTYRETYGGEVRNPKWLAQFRGRTARQEVKVDRDIRNVSGATLSSVHVTDGVRRLLHTWELVLKKR